MAAIGQAAFAITKDPAASVDVGLDLAAPVTQIYQPWLTTGETVINLLVTADPGLTIGATSVNANASGTPSSLLIAWISGGVAGNTYTVHFQFTTNQGRTDVRSIIIKVQSR